LVVLYEACHDARPLEHKVNQYYYINRIKTKSPVYCVIFQKLSPGLELWMLTGYSFNCRISETACFHLQVKQSIIWAFAQKEPVSINEPAISTIFF
jgi:hypothetical protein